MTLVSDIIQQAYRETNIIPLGAAPTGTQSVEGLSKLNTIVMSAVGNEIAEPGFEEVNIGGDFDQSSLVANYVPDNTRLVLNLSDGGVVVGLSPSPYEGQRVAIADMGGNVATYNVIIDGNGRNIEGLPSVTIAENNVFRHWMYRSDIGSWVRINPLTELDEMPFPNEFDDYFITMLALRLAPRYGLTLPQESIEILKRSRNQLRARYRNRHYVPLPDPGLLSRKEYSHLIEDEAFFDLGRWPWLL